MFTLVVSVFDWSLEISERKTSHPFLLIEHELRFRRTTSLKDVERTTSLKDIERTKKAMLKSREGKRNTCDRSSLYPKVLDTNWHNNGSCAPYTQLISDKTSSLLSLLGTLSFDLLSCVEHLLATCLIMGQIPGTVSLHKNEEQMRDDSQNVVCQTVPLSLMLVH